MGLRWNLKYTEKREIGILCLKAVLMGLLPLLCCLAAAAAQGHGIGEVYLPASEWNDELFYFKQVEGMAAHGFPYGYFGFNESHALKLSFAAWSPVLVLPWLVWGCIFGWSLHAPIYCNIVLMMAAMCLFVLSAKPKWKQLGILTILFCVFTPFTRYMLSGMPEVICFSLLIVWLGLLFGYEREEKASQLAGMLALASLMTLMRPYLILFLAGPSALWVRRKGRRGAVGAGVLFAAVAGIYAAVKHYLGAEYFTPLFKTEWVEPFLQGHLIQGVKGVLYNLYHNGAAFAARTLEGLQSGLAEGLYFAGFLAMLGILAWQALTAFGKKKRRMAVLYGYLAGCFLGMYAALLLMYKLTEGSKHLLTFMAMGIFAVSMMETRFYRKAMFLGAACVYLYSVKAAAPYDFAVPYVTEAREEQVEHWREIFSRELTLETEDVPSYDNVIIWVFSDVIETSEGSGNRNMIWQVLYALPEGYGISCCYREYVMENFENLQSRYLATVTGGQVQERCEEAELRLIGQDEDVAVYALR